MEKSLYLAFGSSLLYKLKLSPSLVFLPRTADISETVFPPFKRAVFNLYRDFRKNLVEIENFWGFTMLTFGCFNFWLSSFDFEKVSRKLCNWKKWQFSANCISFLFLPLTDDPTINPLFLLRDAVDFLLCTTFFTFGMLRSSLQWWFCFAFSEEFQLGSFLLSSLLNWLTWG